MPGDAVLAALRHCWRIHQGDDEIECCDRSRRSRIHPELCWPTRAALLSYGEMTNACQMLTLRRRRGSQEAHRKCWIAIRMMSTTCPVRLQAFMLV
ncbi:hypothetical protein VTN96DRAFT_1107 [Rasamsonia emersonii]